MEYLILKLFQSNCVFVIDLFQKSLFIVIIMRIEKIIGIISFKICMYFIALKKINKSSADLSGTQTMA